MSTSESNIVYDQGVHLDGTLIWFDPTKLREFGLVSSARMHLGERQVKALMSDKTARLLHLVNGKRTRALICPYHRPFTMGQFAIELFPSGYMAGAASFQVTLPTDRRVVYSGPFSRVRNRTAERYEVRRCDTLILDATYGSPRFEFPKRRQVEGQVIDWAQETLRASRTPVFLVASPGKAQDLLHLLGHHDLKVRVHRGVYAYNKAYRGVGIDLPACKQFRGHPCHGEVLVWPSHLRKSAAIRNLKKARFAAMTGTGVLPGSLRRLKVNHVFHWSARAGFSDLLDYVKDCQPGEVITVGAHARELADALGSVARIIDPKTQLSLL